MPAASPAGFAYRLRTPPNDVARAAATSDALIAAGLRMMATPPPQPSVPRTIDCSVTPGSLGRSVGCW
jgi:hypothetical protein